MLRGEERVHVGGVSGGDAAADGAESPPHAAHANRHPVPHHVPTTGRLRHEHLVPPHRQAGVEVSQSVGRICEVLPEDEASVVQRPAPAAARTAEQRVRTLPGDERASSSARPLLHTSPASSYTCLHHVGPGSQ